MPSAGRDVTYIVSDYPETTRLLSASILIGSEPEPLFTHDETLTDRYVEAIDRVLRAADQLTDYSAEALVSLSGRDATAPCGLTGSEDQTWQ
jgi:hypothetical protein